MKAKTQDEEGWRPLSRRSLVRRPVRDQLGAPPTSSLLEGPLRGVSSSHEESPPRTRSLCHARAVPDSDWGVGHDTRRDPETRTSSPRRVRDRFPASCKHNSWRPVQAAGPNRGLNAGLLSCTAIPSPSSPTLLDASSAWGTQALPMTSSGLRLGLNVVG
jgi:hypothetical protein